MSAVQSSSKGKAERVCRYVRSQLESLIELQIIKLGAQPQRGFVLVCCEDKSPHPDATRQVTAEAQVTKAIFDMAK